MRQAANKVKLCLNDGWPLAVPYQGDLEPVQGKQYTMLRASPNDYITLAEKFVCNGDKIDKHHSANRGLSDWVCEG